MFAIVQQLLQKMNRKGSKQFETNTDKITGLKMTVESRQMMKKERTRPSFLAQQLWHFRLKPVNVCQGAVE